MKFGLVCFSSFIMNTKLMVLKLTLSRMVIKLIKINHYV